MNSNRDSFDTIFEAVSHSGDWYIHIGGAEKEPAKSNSESLYLIIFYIGFDAALERQAFKIHYTLQRTKSGMRVAVCIYICIYSNHIAERSFFQKSDTKEQKMFKINDQNYSSPKLFTFFTICFFFFC